MAVLKQMFKAQTNSIATSITNNVSISDTSITVLDGAILPDAPSLLVLGSGVNAETIKMTAKNIDILTVERGFQGSAKAWNAGTSISRNFTAYDHDAFLENIEQNKTSIADLEVGKVDKDGSKVLSDLNYTQEDKDQIGTNKNDITDLKAQELITVEHLTKQIHEGELHGLRLQEGKLEYFDGMSWQGIKGDGYPVGNVKNFAAKGDNKSVTLTLEDPANVTITDSSGSIITIARWKGTKILRKVGSYPVNENDGVLVIDNGIRDQYKTNGFTDTGLTNEVEYYYMAFPYTEDGVYTVDPANRVAAIPTDVDDKTDSPGGKILLGGDMNAGYFGVVPASELFTGTELASLCGITEGTSQFSSEGWLKFAIDGKIIFKSKKTIRHSISWDHINSKGCVKGTKTVTKGGHTYKVRLMKGALTDPSRYDLPDRGAKGSEWNKLMLPIHIKAKDKSWAYPAYVETDIPYWGIDFTDADLQTHNSHGDGSYHWCQEVSNDNPASRVYRGIGGVSSSGRATSSNTFAYHGWSPVLEWVS